MRSQGRKTRLVDQTNANCSLLKLSDVKRTKRTNAHNREPSNQATKQPTKQSTKQSTHQPTNPTTHQPTKQPSSQPSNKATNQPTKQPANQPTNQPTNQSSNPPTNPRTNHLTNESLITDHYSTYHSHTKGLGIELVNNQEGTVAGFEQEVFVHGIAPWSSASGTGSQLSRTAFTRSSFHAQPFRTFFGRAWHARQNDHFVLIASLRTVCH